MIYPDNFETTIGFDVVRRELKRYCASAMGVERCEQMGFSSRSSEFIVWLQQGEQMLKLIQSGRELPLGNLHDLRSPLLGIGTPGSHLTTDQLHSLREQLTNVGRIASFFRGDVSDASQSQYKHIKSITDSLHPLPEVTASINAVLDPHGNVRDNASPLLQELRDTLRHIQASIATIMRRVITRAKADGVLDSDVQPGMRDGRLVLPVAPANKRRVRGIVHDESATGKTLYIEPEEIVEANNRIRETEAEIARELLHILIELTDTIRPHVTELLSNVDTLGLLDFIRAKAQFARDIDGQMPTVHDKPLFEWYHAAHPALTLSLREHGKQVVPMDLQLDESRRILVISGPNAGGKSVCLKTVGVVQYMIQCGVLPSLYSNSHVGTFENMMVDIGDQQSIEDELSTYSSHLFNMRQMMQRAGRGTLLLIDEFGSGTEPQMGGALAQAILAKFALSGSMGIITTHYHNLKQMADTTDGLVNGAMLYDRSKMTPLFQLQVGYPGSSFAIEIARKIGLPADVLANAEEIVGSDYINMDKYLLDIARDRRYWEHKRHEIRLKEKRIDEIAEEYNTRLEELAARQRQILHDARVEARELLSQSNAQIERTIKEIREMQAERERTREAREQLEEFRARLNSTSIDESAMPLQPLKSSSERKGKKIKKQKPIITADTPLQVGDRVLMKGGNTVGTILMIDEKYATVAFGAMKVRVETGKIERTMRKENVEKHSALSAATLDDIRSRQLSFKPDIDVRGMRADEALQAVTYFIDDAIQFQASRVRILHGTGTGVLREVLRGYLNSVPGVKSVHDEHVQFGGAGITVVDLE